MASAYANLTPSQLHILRDQNHDAQIIAAACVFSVLAVFATVVRILSRRMRKTALGADDVLIMIALPITLAQSVFIAYGVRHYGLGRHLLTLSKEQQANFQKLWYTVGLLQPTLLAITKLSVLILFYRIFAKPLFQFFIWILGAIVIFWWIGAFLADALICIPIQHNWHPEIPGHCGNKNLLAIITPIPWIVTDLVIVIMPLPMVWHLHLPASQRVGLGILFLLGGFALVSSCVRYSTLFFQHADVTYYITPATVWTIIESDFTIISACLIVSRPCLIKLYPEKLIQRLSSDRSRPSQRSRWRKYYPGAFSRLAETPPKVTNISMGAPFAMDVEAGKGERR